MGLINLNCSLEKIIERALFDDYRFIRDLKIIHHW